MERRRLLFLTADMIRLATLLQAEAAGLVFAVDAAFGCCRRTDQTATPTPERRTALCPLPSDSPYLRPMPSRPGLPMVRRLIPAQA